MRFLKKTFRFPVVALLILATAGTAWAQDLSIDDRRAINSYRNAITAFDARNHTLALDLLDEALERVPEFVEAHLLRFEIYAETGDMEAAEGALKDALAIDADIFPNAWFFLAGLELRRGAYADAAEHFTEYLGYRGTNPAMREKAERELANCRFAMEMMANPKPFEPVNLGEAINTSMPEYYPTVTADDGYFIFTRLVNDPDAFRGKNEDFYWTRRGEDGAWERARPLADVNTLYNEGAPSISGDGRFLVFTGCELMGDYGPGRTGFGSCDLFYSERVGGKWSQPENLGKNINSNAWESQPSLSADGKTLYFVRGYASRGGVREQDIYVSKRFPHGTWGVAEKLPMNVNTPGREESVQIHPDGVTLYFSSNGHVGMGGLDIYRTRKIADGVWEDPVNLGYPINTHGDENSLLVSASGRVAYFASDREGGFGGLDLYSFELPEEFRPTPVTYARGVVVDAADGSPVSAELVLSDVDSNRVVFDATNDPVSGGFLVALPRGRTYALGVKSPGYLYHSETFVLEKGGSEKPYDIRVEMQRIEEGNAVVLKNVFFDLDKSELQPRSKPELAHLAQFMRANPEVRIRIEGHTDDQGDAAYNKALSERRAEAVKLYLTENEDVDGDRISTMGFGADRPIADNAHAEGRAMNRRTEFRVISH